MTYERQIWVNRPDQTTPLADYRMNHIESGIVDAHEEIGGRLSEASLRQTIADGIRVDALPHGGLVPRALNTWGAFDGTNLTYPAWISGIDTALDPFTLEGRVSKSDLGPSSQADRHIFAYTGGAESGMHVLLVGGTHADEQLSQWSAREWFHQFLASTDPTMITLRSTLRVTWVPTLTPSGFKSARTNANGVNINRNYDFFWASSSQKEGTAPFSEPEAAAVKKLLDDNPIAAVIDCHTIMSDQPDRLAFLAPSPMVAGHHSLGYVAAAQWQQLYAPTTPYADLGELDYSLSPTLSSWAQAYLRFQKQRHNAAAITVESPERWAGSASWGDVSQEAVRRYCGYITLWLIQWLTASQTPLAPRPYIWAASRERSTEQQTVDVSAGGTRIPNTPNGEQFVAFSTQNAEVDPAVSRRAFMDFSAPSPGSFMIEFDGYITTNDATGGYVILRAFYGFADGSLTSVDDSVTAVTMPAAAGAHVPFVGSARVFGVLAPDVGKRLHRVRLGVYGEFAAGSSVRLRRANVRVTHIPNDISAGRFDGYDPLPAVRRGAS